MHDRGKQMNAARIVVQRDKKKKRFVVTKPPFPKIGDVCKLDGEDWEVIETERTNAFSISFPKASAKKVSHG